MIHRTQPARIYQLYAVLAGLIAMVTFVGVAWLAVHHGSPAHLLALCILTMAAVLISEGCHHLAKEAEHGDDPR